MRSAPSILPSPRYYNKVDNRFWFSFHIASPHGKVFEIQSSNYTLDDRNKVRHRLTPSRAQSRLRGLTNLPHT